MPSSRFLMMLGSHKCGLLGHNAEFVPRSICTGRSIIFGSVAGRRAPNRNGVSPNHGHGNSGDTTEVRCRSDLEFGLTLPCETCDFARNLMSGCFLCVSSGRVSSVLRQR